MTTIDSLTEEFEHEAQTTRKHLEHLPSDKLAWRPHEKSFTLGGLASHIVECVGWAEPIFNQHELDIDPATFRSYRATSLADLLNTFDDRVADCRQALARAGDADLMQPWRFKIMGRLRFEKPRVTVFRDFTLSHLISSPRPVFGLPPPAQRVRARFLRPKRGRGRLSVL